MSDTSDTHEQALYSLDQFHGDAPGCEGPWDGFVVKEHTLFAGDPTTSIVAYCANRWTAEQIRDALRLANAQRSYSALAHLHIDGRELAKAVIPHLHTAIRNATGARSI